MKRKGFKRAGLIIALDVVLILGLVYAFEFFLEWRDPRRHLPPNGWVGGQLVTWGNPVRNNSLGYREREFQTPKPDQVVRIMVLGDSLTWGVGLAPEQRYTNLLEKALNETGAGRFEVLNFGMIAAPTTAERDVLSRFGAHVQPDLILVGFCLNDPQPRGQNYSVERERFDGKYKRRFDSLKYRLSLIHLRAFADLLVQAAYGLAEKTGTVPTWDQGLGRTYVESSPEWRAFVEALRDIKRMSDDMRLPAPVFAVLNQSGGTGSDFSHPDELLTKILGWTRQAESAAATAGFKTLNYEKEIPVEIANESTGINEIDRHPSAKLNALYAKKLFAVISDHLALNDKKKLDQAKKQ